MMSPSMHFHGHGSPRASSIGVARGNTLRSSAQLRGSKSLTFLHSNGSKTRAAARLPERGSIVAAAAASSLQQTARGWLESYDSRLSQNFWCKQAAPPGGRSHQDDRVTPVSSPLAQRENFKKEHYGAELDRISEEQRILGSQASAGKVLSYAKAMEDLETKLKRGFDMSAVDGLLLEAKKQHKEFRPYRLQWEEARQQDGPSESSKKGEECKKKARKSVVGQQSNPRWRVEERIKEARTLLKDTGEPPQGVRSLPMTQFAVQGEHGREEHALVDVQAIQNKCRGLSASCSVKSLLEAQRLREHEQEALAKKDSETRPTAELEALAKLSWEDRMELAEHRKLQGHISSVFNSMGQMRSKYPKDIPDSIVNHLHAMGQGDFNWHQDNFDY